MRFLLTLGVVALMAYGSGRQVRAESAEPPPANAAEPAAAMTDALKVSISGYMQSGLPNQFPAVFVARNGQLLDFAQGTEKTHALLDQLEAPQAVQMTAAEDMAALQEKLATLLAGQGQDFKPYTGHGDGKVLIVIGPDASLGECPPCSQLLARIQPAAQGVEQVRQILLEQD